MNRKGYLLLYYVFILLSLAGAFLIDSIVIVGLILIIQSILLCIVTKKTKKLFLLVIIITLINISVGVNIGILGGKSSPVWHQQGLLSSGVNLITLKGILLTQSILSIGVYFRLSKYLKKEKYKEKLKKSRIITIIMMIMLIGILIFGLFTEILYRKPGYISVQNPIFEYSCILLSILWSYSKKNKKIKFFMLIYGGIFTILFLKIGDRSSVVPILITIIISLYINKISLKNLVIYGLIGIFIYNFVGIYRGSYNITFTEVIERVIERGFYIDTISWAYYTSIAISYLFLLVQDSWKFGVGYFFYFITGIETKYFGMQPYAVYNFDFLFSRGGGIYSSFFYGMLGYTGVIIGGILLVVIVNGILLSKSKYSDIYSTVLISLSFRWYLYNITPLYRGVLVITTVALIFCKLIEYLEKKLK